MNDTPEIGSPVRCCLLCGRWGTRGFREAWQSDGVTGEGFVCTNDRACRRRVTPPKVRADRLTPEVLAALKSDNERAKRKGWRAEIGVDDVDLLLEAATRTGPYRASSGAPRPIEPEESK